MKKRAMVLAAWLAIMGLGTALAAAPELVWPKFRGPDGMASSDAAVPTTWSDDENIVWKTPMPGPGTSSPIVVGDTIYLTSYSGYNIRGEGDGQQEDLKRHLLCIRRSDGQVVWSRDLPAKLPEQDRIRDGHGYASSTPAADAERVYVFAGKSGVLAFDHSGKRLWQTDVGDGLHGWGSAASPVLYENLVIINASVESESLVALDKRTGEQVWRVGGIRESWNTPILVAAPGGKTELVLAIAGKVLGIDPASGESLWQCDTDIGWYMVPSLVAEKGVVYCVGGRTGGALAVKVGGRGEVTDSHRVWTGKKGSNVTSPIVHDGHLYWMHENLGIAYCAEAATGKIVYEQRLDRAGQVYGSPVLAGGKIYYTTRDGKTFVVAARPKFELLATNTLESRGMFNASPAIAGDQLFMRSDKYLYCIGKR